MTPARGRIIAAAAGAGVLATAALACVHWREIADRYRVARMTGEWVMAENPFDELKPGYRIQRGKLLMSDGERITPYVFWGLKISRNGSVKLTEKYPSAHNFGRYEEIEWMERHRTASFRVSGNRIILTNHDRSEEQGYPFDFDELEYRVHLESSNELILETDWGSIRYSRVTPGASRLELTSIPSPIKALSSNPR